MKRIIILIGAVAATSALAHEGKSHTPGDEHQEPATTPAAAPAEHGHGHGDHAHASPHGGMVATIDKDVHVEIVFGDKVFGVYFYDANMRPIALASDGKATVVVGKDVKKLELAVATRL